MSARAYDDLLRALGKGELAPVYYLCGAEDILKDEAVRAILDRALEPHERDFNFDQRAAQGLAPEELHALVNTLPMLASRRVVVIRDIEAWKKKAATHEVLQKYLANPAAETVLILVEGAPNPEKDRHWEPDAAIAARSFAVQMDPLPPDRVARWLAWHAKGMGLTFGEGAAEHLALAVGYDLGTLRAELEKFSSIADQGPVSRDTVGELVGIRHGETLEDWIEALLADDTPRAISLGRQVLEQAGMTGVKMITALGTALVGMRLARAHYEKGSRGGALERTLMDRFRAVRPFGIGDWKVVARQWSRAAETWSGARLRTALRATLEADAALKGTRVSDETGVVLGLVLRLGGSATRRPDGSSVRQVDGSTMHGATR
ncbi:MAG: DNA polymerase III subunit delta [Gemmatimonadales bacterium]|nr:DNA polymerase III subunit delta [Gemmatimonadales bacterium]